MDEKRIAKLRGLCERATAGPWVFGCNNSIMNTLGTGYGKMQRKCDADFVIAARTALPEALDEIVRLTAELAAEKKRADAAMADCSGYCATCAFVDDCMYHDNNDAGQVHWYYGDCEHWEWSGEEGAVEDAAD